MEKAIMNDIEIELIANKVADILERRFNERQHEMTARAMDLLLNTPIKSREDYEKELARRTGRQIKSK